jgi:hypothetical protein
MENILLNKNKNKKLNCNGIIIENGILFNGVDPHCTLNSNNNKSEDDYIIPKVKAPRGKNKRNKKTEKKIIKK